LQRRAQGKNGAGRGESFLLLSSHGRQQQGAGHVRRPGKNGARLLEKKAGQRGGVAMGDLHEHPPPELRGRRALGGGVRALGAGNRELAAGCWQWRRAGRRRAPKELGHGCICWAPWKSRGHGRHGWEEALARSREEDRNRELAGRSGGRKGSWAGVQLGGRSSPQGKAGGHGRPLRAGVLLP
jgi:hypothetical protein